MHQILKRFVVLIVSSILLILVISSFTPVCVAISASSVDSEPEPEYSRAKGSEYIVELWSEAKDETEDSSFDTLNFGIKLNIPSSDEYLFDAVLKPLGIHAYDYVRKNLDVGEHEVILTFDGTDIYKGGRDGPFTINVTVYKGNSEIMIEVEHETESYLFLDFNPKPIKESSGMELITVVNNTIRLETETFVVKIYELTPSIVFYYKSDDGQTTRFRISYEDIIGFNDENSDGVYQVEELKYWGQLEDSQWSSPKTLIEDFNNFDFQVQTIVDLFDANSKPVDSTRIELVFHYSSLSKAEDIEAARKFDISIKILGAPLEGLTHLALKH